MSSQNGFSYVRGLSHNVYTITGGTGTGVARFTYYVTGTFSGSINFGVYEVYLASDGGSRLRGQINLGGPYGDLPPQTTTWDIGFTYGQPFESHAEIYAQLSANGPGQSANATLQLRAGGYTVIGAPNYTGSSSTGTTRGGLFAPSAPYDGFTVQNNVGFGSITTLLDGDATTERNVSIGYVAPMPNFPAVSDIVDIQGTNTDPVVIQIKYDPLRAAKLFGGETALRLAWLNSAAGQWVLATLGNAGGGPQFFNRAYNPATDFQLGNYGLDTENDVVWAVVNHNSEFAVTALPDPFGLTAATSRKTHGNSGTFDVPVALTTPSSVECRTGGATGQHTLVFTFSGNVASGDATVTSGTGAVAGTPTFSGNTMTVALTGVTNAQRLTVTLANVTSTASEVLPNTAVTLGFLLGDTSGSGSVNATDIGQTKAQSGQAVTISNFRTDVTANGGAISASDIGQVKSTAGTQLP
jgi:hypothetical protein